VLSALVEADRLSAPHREQTDVGDWLRACAQVEIEVAAETGGAGNPPPDPTAELRAENAALRAQVADAERRAAQATAAARRNVDAEWDRLREREERFEAERTEAIRKHNAGVASWEAHLAQQRADIETTVLIARECGRRDLATAIAAYDQTGRIDGALRAVLNAGIHATFLAAAEDRRFSAVSLLAAAAGAVERVARTAGNPTLGAVVGADGAGTAYRFTPGIRLAELRLVGIGMLLRGLAQDPRMAEAPPALPALPDPEPPQVAPETPPGEGDVPEGGEKEPAAADQEAARRQILAQAYGTADAQGRAFLLSEYPELAGMPEPPAEAQGTRRRGAAPALGFRFRPAR